jgi:hypothetical protein
LSSIKDYCIIKKKEVEAAIEFVEMAKSNRFGRWNRITPEILAKKEYYLKLLQYLKKICY